MLPVEAQAARLAPIDAGVREGGRHAVVFEAARGVHSLVLQVQLAGLQADVLAHAGGRLAAAFGPSPMVTTCSRRGEGQQLVEPPHAAEAERIVAAGPFCLEKIERAGRPEAVPVVDHVEQAAAHFAGDAHFVDAVGRAARRRDAPLEGNIGHGGDANGWWLLRLHAGGGFIMQATLDTQLGSLCQLGRRCLVLGWGRPRVLLVWAATALAVVLDLTVRTRDFRIGNL